MTSLLTALLLASLAAPLPRDEGQGTATPDAHLQQLRAGSYVFGEGFEAEQHVGEVVLVVFGGS